ncbi:MAG: MBL fold metallo-hydrolase [Phycisphaerales bacterium]|nr:MAG: MBL fold metallo-hydrolase [Phycisphaerales bacterium]
MTATWSWKLLKAGSFRLDGGSMFGVVPKVLWSRLVEPDELNRIPLHANCLLLEDGEHKVLIETGCGGKWAEKDRQIFAMDGRTILDALREEDVDPNEITRVIVTHLHFDHAGGLTHLDANGNAVSSFPNAKILSQKTEWEDAVAGRSTMSRTYLRDHLDPVQKQMRLVDGEAEILPGLRVWPLTGHTWGHQVVRFADEAGTVCFAGDVMPTVHHVGAAFSMGYDMLPHANMQSKLTLLRQAAAENWRIALDHEPETPVVRVQADPADAGRFALEPVSDPTIASSSDR